MTLRAIVVDDSLIFRKVVRDSLELAGDIEIVAVASNGAAAVERILAMRPDLVTLDIEMPGMDGLQVLQELQQHDLDTKVIMVSSLTERGAASTTRALALGAFDFILKPDHDSPAKNIAALQKQLNERITAIRRPRRSTGGRASASGPSPVKPTATRRPQAPANRSVTGKPDLVAIGISTGGPQALRQMIGELSPDLPVPIVIVQHMPAMFTASMAKDIDGHSRVTVSEAANGDPLNAGCVYVAPGGKQLRITGSGGCYRAEVTDDQPVRNCKPSIDYLFDSIGQLDLKQVLAIVMTGMGDDGMRGCQTLRQTGAMIWAQDEATSTVYGMPRQVVNAGIADRVLPLDEIAPAIMRSCGKSRPRPTFAVPIGSTTQVTGVDAQQVTEVDTQ